MGSVAWGKQSRGRRRNVASASGVGSLIVRQVCAPAAHEAAPPTGCRLDRDAAGLKEARRRRGARRTRVRRAVLRAAYASQGVGVLQRHG